MKANHLKQIIVLTGCAAALAGCAQQPNQTQTAQPAAITVVSTKSGTVSAYFPIGKANGNGLSVEKSASPALAGQPTGYTYKVSNLTDATLAEVTIKDHVSGNSSVINSDPQPTVDGQGIATWNLGSLGAKQSKLITIKGLPMDESSLITFNCQ